MLELIQNLDGAVLLAIQAGRMAWLDPIVEGYTALGNAGLMWIVLSLVMLCYKPTRKAGFLALCAMGLGLLCTNVVLKHLVARPRPWLDVAGLVPLIGEPDPFSFPSGHTCAAFAAGMVWMKTLPWKWGRAGAVVLAVCMGLSRLYVGVHYPTDVIGGALVGVLLRLGGLDRMQAVGDPQKPEIGRSAAENEIESAQPRRPQDAGAVLVSLRTTDPAERRPDQTDLFLLDR